MISHKPLDTEIVCRFLENLTLMNWNPPPAWVVFKESSWYKLPAWIALELNEQAYCWFYEAVEVKA